jgi:hypothetical protein
MFNPKNFKNNPDYGGGLFRRRIRMVRDGDAMNGEVHGALEDCNHGFQVLVKYRGGRVTELQPQFMRIPFTACDGAWRPLSRLVDVSVSASTVELLAMAPPLSNCTHLHDLTLLSIAHTQREAVVVQYDAEVTDAVDEVSQLRVWRTENDAERVLMHHWQATMMTIVLPEELKDNTLFMGFSRWANAQFSGLHNESAFILQKSNMVSIGRMLDVDGMVGNRAIDENDANSCFTYSPENAATAIRLGNTVRDFTDTPEQLLKFV